MRMAGLNPDLGKRRRQKTQADPAVDLKVLTLDLGTQLEYRFMYLRITHIRSVYTGKTDPGFTQPLQVCGSHGLGESRGCLHSAEGLGAGRPRTVAHLQDGNLPLQRMALFLQEGPGTWTPEQCYRPRSQQSPPRSPNFWPPSYLSPPLPLLPSWCSSTALQPCQPLPG